MAQINERLGTDVLVVQGALDTELMRQGFEGNFSVLNVEEPETIEEIHRRYRDAGADCALTNTFLATSDHLAQDGLAMHTAEVNREGVAIARGVGFPHVLAAMGPLVDHVPAGSGIAALHAAGSWPQGLPQPDEALIAAGPAEAYATAVELHAEQACALAAGCPDAFCLMAFSEVDDILAAIEGCKRVADLPVIACMTFPREATMADIAFAAQALEAAGASAIGTCHMGPRTSVACLGALKSATGLPLVSMPDCGEAVTVPGSSPRYTLGPDALADVAINLVREGARVVGSHGGSTPAHTGAIYAAVGGLQL